MLVPDCFKKFTEREEAEARHIGCMAVSVKEFNHIEKIVRWFLPTVLQDTCCYSEICVFMLLKNLEALNYVQRWAKSFLTFFNQGLKYPVSALDW